MNPFILGGSGRSRGFSLLEVVIASALLLLTVSAVTASVTNASRAGRRLETTRQAERAVLRVIGQLSALPFCPAALPERGGAPADSAKDLLSAVFPHARPELNTAAARYLTADEEGIDAGSFVTRLEEKGAEVLCVARFRAVDGSLLGPSDLGGWDVARSTRLPGAVIEIDVRASTPGGVHTRRLVRAASFAASLGAAPEQVP